MTPAARTQVEPEKNPERRGLRKGLYLIPSVFTAANIAMGFYAVMAAVRGFQFVGTGTEGDLARAAVYLDNAARAIGWAVLFDMLDGRLARMTKTTTEIGVQLDSIADVVTFGLAPAVLAYVWGYGATLEEGSGLHSLAWFLSFMYLMCGAFRLARFNVQASRPRILAEGTIKVDKKSFVGLPIPVAGGLIAAIIHFAPLPLVEYGPERAQIYSVLLMALVGFLSLLMVSTLRFSSFKTVGTRSRSMRTIILAVALGMLIFLYSRYVLLALVVGYILNGLFSRFFGMFRRRSELGEANIQAKLP
ncbi:MAG TPA: CDP-diacylglycerol--serine O-phosphatidyltransferase [Blastocatellia bacterium]|jgi:CDP-diacylglycerol--serine O-phosphatidyltransferase|nr:CDP-diacylglycerol--serine O-phosphatidyltransferase [Blastocatellia bacterium]HAF23214.1 CDP-diacylglycerol--serine O-phosphatidyltransferase [Blastocatellia bacterium]HCX29984.1 CDP-diacylglycerol--serine O-phosphatidyltransferase [Blastocatellia bacterium]